MLWFVFRTFWNDDLEAVTLTQQPTCDLDTMAHLEQLFRPEGLPQNSYHSMDSRVTYKSQSASSSSETRHEIKPLKKDFHPITTEIHVTELRPIKLDPMPRNSSTHSSPAMGRKQHHQTWERRLQSESGVSEIPPRSHSQSEYRQQQQQTNSRGRSHETRTETRRAHSASRHEYTDTLQEPQTGMIRTITSRTGSYSGSSPASSPSATLSPRERLGSDFQRRGKSFFLFFIQIIQVFIYGNWGAFFESVNSLIYAPLQI